MPLSVAAGKCALGLLENPDVKRLAAGELVPYPRIFTRDNFVPYLSTTDLSGRERRLAGSEDRSSEFVLTQQASSYRGGHAVGEPRSGLGEACGSQSWSEPATTGRLPHGLHAAEGDF